MSYASQYEAIFGEKYIKEPYKYKAHSFNRSVVGKQYCSRCGLIALNNPFTKWAVRMGCNNADHSQFKSQLKKARK